VAVVEIPESAFRQFNNIERCRSLWFEEFEREWFADTSGRVVGALVYDPSRSLWGYHVCVRGDDGNYARVALAADIPTADMARVDLVATMAKL
jgi:hypothetical protein